MMFNTYDVEDGKETEENQECQSKRNRGNISDQHTLLTVPPPAKHYKERPVYKWKCTQKAKYQQLACFTSYKTQTQTYCRCNLYKICKHCHVKHVVTVTNGNSSDNSQNEGNAQKPRKTSQKKRVHSLPIQTV